MQFIHSKKMHKHQIHKTEESNRGMASQHLRMMKNDLPEELMTDILARLPAKSLMRFKSVKHSWEELIKSLNFVTKHMNNFSHERSLMVFDDPGDRTIHDHKLATKKVSWNSPTHPPEEFKFPLLEIMENICYVLPFGPCNGIYLLFVFYKNQTGKLVLWNPSTREVKFVPTPQNHLVVYNMGTTKVSFGFGFDSEKNDYTIVAMLLSNDSGLSIDFFSLSTNSWIPLDHDKLPCVCEVSEYSVFSNSACYWVISCSEDIGTRFVLCYDVANDEFREINVPIFQNTDNSSNNNNNKKLEGYVHINKVDDTLGYVVQYSYGEENDDKAEIWLLKDNVEGIWTKVFHMENVDSEITRSFGFVPNGQDNEVLAVENDRALVSFNLQWQRAREFRLDGVQRIVHILDYETSIAPLSI